MSMNVYYDDFFKILIFSREIFFLEFYLKYEEVTLREQASQVKRIPQIGMYIVRLSTKSVENEICDLIWERLWRNPEYVVIFLNETFKKKTES